VVSRKETGRKKDVSGALRCERALLPFKRGVEGRTWEMIEQKVLDSNGPQFRNGGLE